jgi:hypothetical protein
MSIPDGTNLGSGVAASQGQGAILLAVIDETPTSEELLLAWQDTTRAAELAERLAALALDAADHADERALAAEEIATVAETAARSAEAAAVRAREGADLARVAAGRARERSTAAQAGRSIPQDASRVDPAARTHDEPDLEVDTGSPQDVGEPNAGVVSR